LRILVVIPHYFGPSDPANNLPEYASNIEPIGRIAALNEMIVALLGHFGRDRYTFTGEAIAADGGAPPRQVDIVIMTMRDRNILAQLGLAPGTFNIEYVDGKAPWIPLHAQSLLRDRLGSYDFYCYMEDDLIIRDPAFFEKLLWFQRTFGPKTLLAPVRFELASTGTPAKVIIDPELPEDLTARFRRPGQKHEIAGIWNGRSQTFQLANNPHAGCFFLTQQQMAYWVEQPSFDDHDASWIGPMESAGTLSIGKVFDIYKPVRPDPFFLEVQHFGARYAAQFVPPGSRRGEPPLLAIAQNALRAAIEPGGKEVIAAGADGSTDGSFARFVEQWLAQGTAVEHRAQIDTLRLQVATLTAELKRRQIRAGAGSSVGSAAPAPVPAHNPHDPSHWGKVGRNEPCPCGSGKKFKHCHG
jgi:hypothetical protein